MISATLAPWLPSTLLASTEARFVANLFTFVETGGHLEAGLSAGEALEALRADPAILFRSQRRGLEASLQGLHRFHQQQTQALFPDDAKWQRGITQRHGVEMGAYRVSHSFAAEQYLHLWMSVLERGVSEFVGRPSSWQEASRVIERYYTRESPQSAAEIIAMNSIHARELAWVGLESMASEIFSSAIAMIEEMPLRHRVTSLRLVIVNIGAVSWSVLPSGLVQGLFKLCSGLGRNPIRPQIQREIVKAIETAGYKKFAEIFLRYLPGESEK